MQLYSAEILKLVILLFSFYSLVNISKSLTASLKLYRKTAYLKMVLFAILMRSLAFIAVGPVLVLGVCLGAIPILFLLFFSQAILCLRALIVGEYVVYYRYGGSSYLEGQDAFNRAGFELVLLTMFSLLLFVAPPGISYYLNCPNN